MTASSARKKTAVLFVHGIQGSPAQFQFLTRSLPEGTAYKNVLLPGHGGTVRQFRRSGRDAWARCVRKAAVELGQTNDRVIFVGHSMGCLLGLQAAMDGDLRFESMLLIACPFRLRLSLRALRSMAKAVSARPTDDPAVLAARKANSVRARHFLAYCTCLKPYADLLRLIRSIRTRKNKPLLRVTAAYPEKDEIVAPASWRIAQNEWRFAPVLLPGCTHHYFTPEAQKTLQRILRAMIDG